jgi:PAS domain-containing protein
MRGLGLWAAAFSGGVGAIALVFQAMNSGALLQVTSVPTALGLLSASLGLLLSPLRDRRWLRVFDVMALLTLVGGTFGILSSLYGWYEAKALGVAFRNTALSSGIALGGLGLSVALLRPERGLAGAVLDAGPSGALLRRLLPAEILLPAALGFLNALADRHGWFQNYGNAPFVMAEISAIVWLVTRSARSVRRFNAQREVAQGALEEEMRAHASLLTERELRFRLLAEIAPQIVWTASHDGSIDYLSPAWSRFTG